MAKTVRTYTVPFVLLAVVVLGIMLAQRARAQWPLNFTNPPRGLVLYGSTYMPNSSTDVWTSTVYVDFIYLHNKSGAPVTVSIKDRSTDCNGAACELLTTTSIASTGTWTVHLPGGIRCRGGLNVQASAANSIMTQIRAVQ